MNIGLLSFEYPPETGFGGIGTYTWYHARALVKLGHRVTVLAGATKTTELRSEEHDGVVVWRYRSDNGWMRAAEKLGAFQLWWSRNRLENGASMCEGLNRLLDKHRFDVIEMPECGAEGLFIDPRKIHVPTVVKLHSPAKLIMPWYDVRGMDRWLCPQFERLGMRRATGYTSCSEFLADEAHRRLGIKVNIPVIPNGIDVELFDDQTHIDVRKKYDVARDQLVILFCGRMERRKGFHLCLDIVDAIIKNYPVTFLFAGQDTFKHMVNDFLPALDQTNAPGSVRYIGRLDQAEVRSCIRQCDVFLMPSMWENCPYSCLEAMVAGRAIVASNVGGLPELVVDNETGSLASNEGPESFVTALARLIEDSALRERLGTSARRFIETTFRDTIVARRAVQYYEAVGSE